MTDKTTRSLICDGCDKELIADTPMPAHYHLELQNINTNYRSGHFVYGVVVRPILDRKKHFCDLKCLALWLEEESKDAGPEDAS